MHTVVVYSAALKDGAYRAKGSAIKRFHYPTYARALAQYDFQNGFTHTLNDGSRRRSFVATIVSST